MSGRGRWRGALVAIALALALAPAMATPLEAAPTEALREPVRFAKLLSVVLGPGPASATRARGAGGPGTPISLDGA